VHRLVYVGYLLMVASGGVTFAFFEEFETDYGLPAWGIGLISSLTFITTLIAALIIAPYGDRGHLTLLGAISFITAILGNLWIGYADELWSLSVSRGLAGIGTGLFSVVGRNVGRRCAADAALALSRANRHHRRRSNQCHAAAPSDAWGSGCGRCSSRTLLQHWRLQLDGR